MNQHISISHFDITHGTRRIVGELLALEIGCFDGTKVGPIMDFEGVDGTFSE